MKSKEQLYFEIKNLIHYIVNSFKSYGNSDDLYQAGCLGFIKAYENYNPNVNCKFTTYAYSYILGEIKSAIRNDKSIHISRDITNLNCKIEKAYALLSQKLMKEPSIQEVSRFLEIPESLVSEAINSNLKVQSIDSPINTEGKDMTYQDVVGTKKELDDLIMLKELLNNLSLEEKTIVLGKYLNGYTQEEIAKMIGINQVQVSRKERKVLKKLNQKMQVKIVA